MNNPKLLLNLLVLRSDNIDRLKNFYSILFSTNFEYHKHGNGPFHYSTYLDDLIFEIYSSTEKYNQNESLRLGFKVLYLDELMKKLEINSIEILQDPVGKEWGYQSIIRDPDGRKIELTEIEIG